ncbi:UMTA methyltransferase [Colletotrichum orchidophilum]|uniref:UMTA methyltransferase n=1 Tax=Colletotrichum orchidophilum TaxID=1209926 RepID=A0A1G4BR42_9PEZI|nr:UMTA methyltransferase [Colletotrichum orchidophilum]OHF03914.1 UMTA methyltransferase [Colletotrichum orchidophilum]
MADPPSRSEQVRSSTDMPHTTGTPDPVSSGSPEPVAQSSIDELPVLQADDVSTDDDRSIEERMFLHTLPRYLQAPLTILLSMADVTMLSDLDDEMDRLDLAHAMNVKAIGNRLFLAPINKERVHMILDIGTGTGIWAVEMGDIFSNAQVYGNDLSAIQPSWVPPNVKFEIDDVESEWLDDRKYDYIMCRYMLCSIGDWPKLVRNIFKHLTPGGWAEFQDMDSLYYSDDDSFTEKHATFKWNKTLVEAMNSINRDSQPGPKLLDWVVETGFENVNHQKFKIPIGPWAKESHFKDIGLLNLAQVLDGLDAFTTRTFCGVLGYTKEEVLVTLSEVRKELNTAHMFHAQWDLHVVYGQKPLSEPEDSE